MTKGEFGTAIYYHDNNHYVFGWCFTAIDPPNLIYMVGSIGLQPFSTQTFPITLGATYTSLRIEIKVSEVYSDHIVLLVKPTD